MTTASAKAGYQFGACTGSLRVQLARVRSVSAKPFSRGSELGQTHLESRDRSVAVCWAVSNDGLGGKPEAGFEPAKERFADVRLRPLSHPGNF